MVSIDVCIGQNDKSTKNVAYSKSTETQIRLGYFLQIYKKTIFEVTKKILLLKFFLLVEALARPLFFQTPFNYEP
jgi:hypothetical protein